jgi:hypothetical protein
MGQSQAFRAWLCHCFVRAHPAAGDQVDIFLFLSVCFTRRLLTHELSSSIIDLGDLSKVIGLPVVSGFQRQPFIR